MGVKTQCWCLGGSRLLKVVLWSSPSYPNPQDLALLLIARELRWPHFTDALAEGIADLGVSGGFPTSIQVSSPPLHFLTPWSDALS